jgi:hypothetical protein
MIPCLFNRELPNGEVAHIMLHVDDLGCMFPSDGVERDRVHAIMTRKYEEMKVQRGNNVTYIGIELNRIGNTEFRMSMPRRIRKLATKYGITRGRKSPGGALRVRKGDDAPYKDIQGYRSIVMSCRYVAATVKPEILFNTTYLASFQTEPTAQDYADAIRVLEYIFHSINDYMLVTPLGRSGYIDVYADGSDRVHIYDSAHTGHGGIATFVGGCRCSVYNQSNKLRKVVKDSTEAESVTLDNATYTGTYFQYLLAELGYHYEVRYFQDNSAAIQLALKGTTALDRKRMPIVTCINSTHAYLVDPDNKARLVWLNTEYMHGDIHSKLLTCGPIWRYHKSVLLGHRVRMTEAEQDKTKRKRVFQEVDDDVNKVD